MNLQDPITHQFEIGCFHCDVRYDVFKTEWCSCIGRQPSAVCPSCLRCFCSAPQAYQTAFWKYAPPLIVRRRLDQLRKDGERTLAIAPPPAAQAANSTAPLVLVVDDSRLTRLAARAALEEGGYRVQEANDALEALSIIHVEHPDLVLSDAFMPRLDGRELCRMIKKDGATRTTKVALMTAVYTAPRYKTEAMTKFGADDYIPKPFTSARLLASVQKLVGIGVRHAA